MSGSNGRGRGTLVRPPVTAPVRMPSDSLVQNAETARALVPGADPRAIVAAFNRHPFKVGKRVELDPERGITQGGGAMIPAPYTGPAPGPNNLDAPTRVQQLEPGHVKLDMKAPAGLAAVNRVTPEQLLAILVSLISTSKNATEACVRIRQEVSGWAFQSKGGVIA